jgi:hypothetical protein
MPPRASTTDPERICSDCRRKKPVAQFHSKGIAWDGTPKYQSYCRPCANKRRRARGNNPEVMQRAYRRYYERNQEGRKAYAAERRDRPGVRRNDADRHLLRRYNLTRHQWWVMLEEQDYTCPGCLRELDSQGKICVDHDHVTGVVRGLLCDDCNKGLGSCKDDPEVLDRLSVYLRSHRNGNRPL